MEFVLILTELEAQKVLNVLVKEPYSDVVGVIAKIQEQAIAQREAAKE